MLSQILREHIPIDVSKMRSAEFIKSQLKIENDKLLRVEHGSGWKTVDRCPVCQTTDSKEILVKYESPLRQCAKCELWYHLRVPANLDDVYKDGAYEIFATQETPELFEYKKNRFGRERVALLAEVCGSLENKKILEVGCGNGYFLAAAKEVTLSCFGSEYSVKNQMKAQENTGLPIFTDPLESFPEKDFDIAVSFDVVEHVEDPVTFMTNIANLLRPGGHLLLYTPNHDSFSVRTLRELSSYLDVTEHIILFNTTSLKFLADMVGFKSVYQATRGLDVSSVLSYLQHLGEPPNQFLIEHVDELQAMIDHSGCADSLRMIFQKAA